MICRPYQSRQRIHYSEMIKHWLVMILQS